ncbi:helix-turn-helix domain-containing protein [Rhizobium leguminosarum]|uniref:helix-turn-helix domain-containing protein n=1 Tax=Rhizobium leguminosarum TaxID=384 RepID=UPI0016168D49|nr:helix-turn-helix domain-containing protein [Rhizobium leguminosarum]MBB4327817.1 transcriptional regulator with XRE-family HTH domain [Rhizobium leguminosarum]MBB4353482.1 transcriptional regulator with XRE-family HTH domain [Rhizobium leguminosarum]MBB4548431.1 transcriptional regulator with XRE-family HTH domain [Rhizobium leguminosarum]MBB4561446.1 transcriptional regulator with XRE-family HTH domain [Rhizobium leguminosarum]
MLTAEQVRAARALLRMEQRDLAERSGVSLPSIKRLEQMNGALTATRVSTVEAIRAALEAAGVTFIAENGGGPGVRLSRPPIQSFDTIETEVVEHPEF